MDPARQSPWSHAEEQKKDGTDACRAYGRFLLIKTATEILQCNVTRCTHAPKHLVSVERQRVQWGWKARGHFLVFAFHLWDILWWISQLFTGQGGEILSANAHTNPERVSRHVSSCSSEINCCRWTSGALLVNCQVFEGIPGCCLNTFDTFEAA